MSDFQKCPECNKALDMVCVCTPDNYYVQLPASDHVSKKALREWCEYEILRLELEDGRSQYEYGSMATYREILDQFCKEGE